MYCCALFICAVTCLLFISWVVLLSFSRSVQQTTTVRSIQTKIKLTDKLSTREDRVMSRGSILNIVRKVITYRHSIALILLNENCANCKLSLRKLFVRITPIFTHDFQRKSKLLPSCVYYLYFIYLLVKYFDICIMH